MSQKTDTVKGSGQKIKIITDGNNVCFDDKIIIGGLDISQYCTGYQIRCKVGEIRQLTLELIDIESIVFPEVEGCELIIKDNRQGVEYHLGRVEKQESLP